MAELKPNMIVAIRDKAEKESLDIAHALYKKGYENLSKTELFKHKVIYTSDELDFVINNYQKQLHSSDFLENCMLLLDEYKQTKQTSKCNAIYKILNSYFTVTNRYYYDPYSDYENWIGFEIDAFVECPTPLKELVEEKVEQIKAEQNKQSMIDYKKKTNKTVKEIIEELE